MTIIILLCLFLKTAYSTPYDLQHCFDSYDPFQARVLEEDGPEVVVEPSKLNYVLYSRSKDQVALLPQSASMLDPALKIKILIPGWTEHYDTDWLRTMRDKYLDTGVYNVIVFNWTEYTYYPYEFVPKIAKLCGDDLGKFLINLGRACSINLNKVHIIGHSVGAHIAGFAGKAVQQSLAKMVGRITGIDAAGPDFEQALPADRISKNDAKFIDGFHSHDPAFGMERPFGTADFFISEPNDLVVNCLEPQGHNCHDIHRWIRCKHRAVLRLWIDSINWRNMTASSVVNRGHVIIGEHCPRTAQGLYNYFIDKPTRADFRFGRPKNVYPNLFRSQLIEDVTRISINNRYHTHSISVCAQSTTSGRMCIYPQSSSGDVNPKRNSHS